MLVCALLDWLVDFAYDKEPGNHFLARLLRNKKDIMRPPDRRRRCRRPG